MTHQAKPISTEADLLALEETDWPSVLPAGSIYEMLEYVAQNNGDGYALTFLPTGSVDEEPIRFTYAQFIARVRQAANLFRELGVGRNDVVSILAPSLPSTFFAIWGATTAGIANPINFILNEDQLEGLLRAADTKVLVALGPNPLLDIWSKVEAVRSKLPKLEVVLQIGGSDVPEGVLSFETALAKQPSDRFHGDLPTRQDRAIYFHTGGTTGTPKLASRSHDNDMYCAWAASQMWHFTPEAVVCNVLPLFHVAGSIVCGLGPLFSGSEVVVTSPVGLRHPVALRDVWKTAEKYRATHLGGVPTNLVAMLDVPRDGLDLSSIRYTLTGGASLPSEVGRVWREKIGKPLTQIYGMTEGGSAIAGSPVNIPPVEGSVGIRFPYGQWRLAPVENPAGGALPPFQQGVVVIASPGTFLGYLEESQNTGTLLADGSVVTGDLGYTDGQGNLFLNGRAKDLIIRGGHNIDPAIIEEVLVAHPNVALAAAIGRPDEYAGEVPVAYVQLTPGSTITGEELRSWASERISERPALPKEIMVIEQMPVTAVGKIFKPALRFKEAEQIATIVLDEHIQAGRVTDIKAREDKLHGLLLDIYTTEQNPKMMKEIDIVMGCFDLNYRIL